MLERVDVRSLDEGALRTLLARAPVDAAGVPEAVAAVLERVRTGGDAALRELTERFDGCRLDGFRVDPADAEAALEALDPDLRLALELARDQILAWHGAQHEREAHHERLGVQVRELVLPVARAGCYVPGGRAAYPSTVLMTVVPARVAGVPEVVLCVPPRPDGTVPDAVLAAAALAGVDEIHRVGGAQAIAALAYGTESIRPVDVVVGPGNAYVAEAKRQVTGVVGVDGIAGPSEIAIVADATAPPELVAADLLAQAEHGPGGAAVVVTWDPGVADAVDDAVSRALGTLARHDDAAATIASGGRVVLVDDPQHAMAAVNAIAPEHLQLMVDGAEGLVPSVRNAGAVFVGVDAPAVLGDYVAGVNHVLPTGATARFASALGVRTFQKRVHVVGVERGALARLAPYVEVLAETEGLHAHADAVRRRVGGAP
ncbi:MAG: histidinol dehydrogenase 1 [Acidimicrobiia bacterium]|nr:MAG: histidinol dehydrogenase 1 [Acidimicrobiia bacterium]